MDIVLQEGERIDSVCDGLSLIQKSNGFSYGTDALLLAAFIRKGGKVAVEFGSGTGVISLLCEKYKKFKKIYAVEVQNEYYDLLNRNVALNCSNITTLNMDIRDITAEKLGGEVDVVFSNPPYMKTTSGRSNVNDGKNIARHEVMGGIDDFCSAAGKILKHGGLFYCVYRPDRAMDLLCSMRKYDLEPKRMTFVYPYVDVRPCLMLVEAKKGASASMFTTRPFIIFSSRSKDNSDFTADMNRVYRECTLDDEFQIL